MTTWIGQRIRNVRRSKHVRQKTLAHRLGLSPGTLANFEQGRRAVSLDWLQKLADALETPLAFFLSENLGSAKVPSGDPRERRLLDAFRAIRRDEALGRDVLSLVKRLGEGQRRE